MLVLPQSAVSFLLMRSLYNLSRNDSETDFFMLELLLQHLIASLLDFSAHPEDKSSRIGIECMEKQSFFTKHICK